MTATCWWTLPIGTLALLVGCRSAPEPVGAAASLGGGALPESFAVTPARRVSPEAEPPLLQPVRYERQTARKRTRRPPRPAPLVQREAEPLPPAPLPLPALDGPPRRAHASDFTWLIGRLEQGEGAGQWWLRYAEPEQDERFGGVLELVGGGRMDGFHAGDRVRVEGELIDPAPHEVKPAFHPRSLQVLP